VRFRSHLDGTPIDYTPEHAIEVQEALGSDIAVCLDQPVPPGSSTRGDVADATARTQRWAQRCLEAHQRPDQALFGIIQGGLEADLRAESTQAISNLPFDGICIGGLAGDETPLQRRAALDVVVPLLADDPRPRYLMGLGSPMDLLDAVDAGVDMFDSVLPARVARNATLWVPGGKFNMRNARFLDDPRPVQEGCECRLCRSFSRAYLAHLMRADEMLGYRLATCHNLTFTLDFMDRIRSAIRAGTFPETMRELRATRAGTNGADSVDEGSVKTE
jgi:queuine tRNA-ribosyltransferase